MRAGDLYWYNDVLHRTRRRLALAGSGSRRTGVSSGKLVAFSQAWAHFSDIGGMHAGLDIAQLRPILPGGLDHPAGATCHREAVVNEDLLRDVSSQLALPRCCARRHARPHGRGTISVIGACRICSRASARRKMLDGIRCAQRARTPRSCAQAFPRHSERHAIRFVDTVDSDGHGSGPIKLRWKLDDDARSTACLDASESDDQVAGPGQLSHEHDRAAP
jgi:N-methylhydantoinase B